MLGGAGIIDSITDYKGVKIGIIQNESLPAYNSGLKENNTIVKINDYNITTIVSLENALDSLKPGDSITVLTGVGDSYTMTAAKHPEKNTAYLGILILDVDKSLKQDDLGTRILNRVLLWLMQLFAWIQLISLNIGLINLFPIFITDGARMLKLNLESIFKNKERADNIWKNINLTASFIMLILLFLPMLRSIFRFALALLFSGFAQ